MVNDTPALVLSKKDEDAIEHKLDMAFPEEGRKTRTRLDEGHAIVYLREQGISPERICLKIGRSKLVLEQRVALTKLAPDIQQELLTSDHGEEYQPGVVIASMLGSLGSPSQEVLSDLLSQTKNSTARIHSMSDDERRFCLQRILLEKIRKKRMNVRNAEEFFHKFATRTCPNSGLGSRQWQKKCRVPLIKTPDLDQFLLLEDVGAAKFDLEKPIARIFPFNAEVWDYGPPGRFVVIEVTSPPHFMRLWRKGLFWHQMGEKRLPPPGFPDSKAVEEMM